MCVNQGRESATAGKYGEAVEHFDQAKQVLGGHSTRMQGSTPGEAAGDKTLREQWQASQSQGNCKGKSKKTLGALGQPIKKKKQHKQKKHRKMTPIMEEPRRRGCLGWLIGSSMTEEEEADEQSRGSSVCLMGSGLVVAAVGVLMVAKMRAN